MILLDIKHYFEEHKTANLQDLSLHFQRDPEIMRDMLSHWLRKGVIHKTPNPAGCGVSCVQCEVSIAETYALCESRC